MNFGAATGRSDAQQAVSVADPWAMCEAWVGGGDEAPPGRALSFQDDHDVVEIVAPTVEGDGPRYVIGAAGLTFVTLPSPIANPALRGGPVRRRHHKFSTC